LNNPIDGCLIDDLLHYKRILTFKYCNPDYAVDYTVEQIASKVRQKAVGANKACDSVISMFTTTTTSTSSTTTTSTSSTTTTTTSSSSTTTTTTTTAAPIVFPLVEIIVVSGSNGPLTCDSVSTFSLWVENGGTFETATILYNDDIGTPVTSSVWIGNGTIARHWDGAAFVEDYTCL
jgi:hypothetical protein